MGRCHCFAFHFLKILNITHSSILQDLTQKNLTSRTKPDKQDDAKNESPIDIPMENTKLRKVCSNVIISIFDVIRI